MVKKKEEIKDEIQAEVKEEVSTETVATPKKENILAKLFKGGAVTAVVVVVVAVAIAFFAINLATGSPKTVVKNQINKVYNEANKDLKEVERLYKKYDVKKPVKGSFDITLESDMEELKDLSGIKISSEFGYDLDEKIITGTVALENKEKFEAGVLIKEEDVYLKLLDEVIYLSEEAGIDAEYWEEVATLVEEYDIDFKQFETILKSFKNALQKSIDPDALKKSRDKISVGGKDISVNKISFTIDEDSAQYLVKNLAKNLRKDKDFLKAFDELAEEYDLGVDSDDLADELEELEDLADDIELDKSEKVVINLYTKGVFNKVVGASVVVAKQEVVTYVNYGKNFELVVDGGTDAKLVVTGEKKGKETEVTVKYNKEKIATATVRKWEKDVVDFDFKINYDEESIKGSVYIDAKEGKNNISGTYKISLDAGEEINFKIKGSYSFEFDADVSAFSTKNAVDAEDIDFDELQEKLESKLAKDEALQELISGLIDEYEDETIEYNYIDMIVVDEDKAVDLLSKNKATVLYVGSTYYSYYSEPDAREMLDNIEELQEDKDFHAYYLADYYADTKFENAVKDIEHTCKTTSETTDETVVENTESTCDSYPAIYFIKDGKVVKAFVGTASYDELAEALSEIGI